MSRLHIIVLGAAAGGGFPQWNCRCPNCRAYWQGEPGVEARTQAGIAVSRDGEAWLLIGASPDLRQQILEQKRLHPSHGSRHSPIAAVALLNSDVDHVAGLLVMRERQAFEIIATEATLAALDSNPIFSVLAPDLVPRRRVELERPVETPVGARLSLFPVPGKVALWQEGAEVSIGEVTDTTVGAEIEAAGKRICYIPSCAAVTDAVIARAQGCDLLIYDGTCWTDDEMLRLGLSQKTAGRMGHTAMDGPQGSIARFAGTKVGRRVFVHINNSNPVLLPGSPERHAAEAAGWEIGHDGLEITL